MLRLRLGDSTENLRREFQAWLKANPAPSVADDSSLHTFETVGRDWQAKLAEGGWVGMHWPKAYGGRGLTLVEEAMVQEELVRVNSPQLLGLFGLTMVGPVLIAHGTESQKSQFLSNILKANEIWCQGFSEPGAGSDLAAVRTKAVEVSGGFEITGQKIWTSFGHIAEWCFLLARTSEGDKKHQGLTYFLINMKTPGITVRPLKQITGDSEFNEVFFDSAFVPKENIVGQVGGGWKIALSTLMYERVVLTFARQLQSEVTLRGLLRRYYDTGDSLVRNSLGKEVVKANAIRALAYSHLLNYAKGEPPGPEGSLDKLFWSESFQGLSKLAVQLAKEIGEVGKADSQRYLYSRGRTIAAGTSEIQRSIIAERVLGLPRLRFSEGG
jgi:alkylation response protein AidB-like acyl-CoA dehydrogenase